MSGLGQLIAGLFAWAFLPNYSYECVSVATCTRANNMGWRYVWFASGGLVFIMSVLRITVMRLKETPKFLLGEGRDQEVVDTLQFIATKYNRPCSLTMENLTACGTTGEWNGTARGEHAKTRISFAEVGVHLQGLFATKKIGLSTSLIWFSWLLIGLAYPLYNVFLPSYLASRGASFGQIKASITWRNYAIVNVCGIFGPVLAGFMQVTSGHPTVLTANIFQVPNPARPKVHNGCWRARDYGTSTILFLFVLCEHYIDQHLAASLVNVDTNFQRILLIVLPQVFFFCYAEVRSNAQNLGFNCAISFWLNVYYGTLYAYTPEVLPSAHRGTGNGIAIGFNRVMGILSAVIATVANVSLSHVIRCVNANREWY